MKTEPDDKPETGNESLLPTDTIALPGQLHLGDDGQLRQVEAQSFTMAQLSEDFIGKLTVAAKAASSRECPKDRFMEAMKAIRQATAILHSLTQRAHEAHAQAESGANPAFGRGHVRADGMMIFPRVGAAAPSNSESPKE